MESPARQKLIDDCRAAVCDVWLQFWRQNRDHNGAVAMALQVALAATQEHVTKAVNLAVEMARKPAAPANGMSQSKAGAK